VGSCLPDLPRNLMQENPSGNPLLHMRKIRVGPVEEVIAELPAIPPITLEFAMWLQQLEVFDELVKELNNDQSPLGNV
jgi:hypothetical protein